MRSPWQWGKRIGRNAAFVLLAGLLVGGAAYQANDRRTALLDNEVADLNNAYQAAIETYRLSSGLIFDEAIDRAEILELFAPAKDASESERAEIRHRLYRALLPTFQNLKRRNLRQLHFHLPDSTSFLRFHRPEKFGDSLLTVRPSVAIANRDRIPVTGFEEGRIFNGFRYVFPLFVAGQSLSESGTQRNQIHIGSVETSVSFDAIQDTMEEFSDARFDFLIAKSVVKAKVFNDEQNHYQPSEVYPAFLTERNDIHDLIRESRATIDRETAARLADRIRDRAAPRMADYENFALAERLDGKAYTIGFLAVRNIEKKTVGYIVSYEETPELIHYNQIFWVQAIGILGITVALWGFLRGERRRAALSRRKDELQASNQQLADEVNRRVATEEKLRATNQTLEQEVAARTEAEQLSADRARQLERVLEELQSVQLQLVQNEKMSSLGQLVAGVAHEINNSTNFINGNLLLLNDYAADLLSVVDVAMSGEGTEAVRETAEAVELEFLREDLQAMLKSMKTGADRTCEIVRSLRNFSRLDESECKATDLHEGIESTLVILGNRLKSKGDRPGIEIVRDYDDAMPLTNCYPGPLNQVIMNLLSNAIDAIEDRWAAERKAHQMPTPGCLELATEYQPGKGARIAIGDNGTGMSEETLKRIFQHLFTTKPTGKGTGLGLAIARDIVENKHGGKISCRSTLGQGTTFIIELPLDVERGDCAKSAARPNADRADAPPA